jgi:uncharacterized protein YbjT (DUF2867 family)
MYAVTGATGNTGRVVAEALLAAGKDVLVIGRSADRLRPLTEKGAEAFVGSVDDAQSLSIAFSGAVGVYCMIPLRYDTEDVRAYQRNIGESLTAAVHEAGVQHVVFLSSIGAQHKDGTGPIAGLREQEDRLAKLEGVNVLNLRPGWFMENLLFNVEMIRQLGVVGTPIEGDRPLAMIATRDVGAYAAERLVALDFEGNGAQELLGPADVSLVEAARAIGAAIGMKGLQYSQSPFDDFEKAALGMGMGRSAVSNLCEMYRAFNDGLVVAEEERSAANTTPTTIEDFAQVFAGVYTASAKK